MKRIELLGPSGVGKTTLYNKICQTSAKDRPYITLDEAYKAAALYKQISTKEFRFWLYQKFLKTGIFKSKELGLARVILYGLKRESGESKIGYYDNFKIAFTIYFESLKNKSHPYVALKRITVFTEKVEEYLILDKSIFKDSYILFDEGMIHKHPGIKEYGLKTYSTVEIKKDPTFSPTGIISCEQSADVIFNQAMERKKQGVYTFTQGRMSEDELRNHVKSSVRKHQEKISLFKDIDIPVLHINMREHADSNMKKINDFVSSLGS